MLRNEGALQEKVLTWLRALPGSMWENRSPGRFSPSGVADITGCYAGRFVAIELKHPRTGRAKDVTDEQRHYLRKVQAAGGFALATNSFVAVTHFIENVESCTAAGYTEFFA